MSRPLLVSDLPQPPDGRTGFPWTKGTKPRPKYLPGGASYPRISVVTPSYNQGQFLEETIRSVLLQGYPNLEYIVIDGGSSDDSVQIIEKYASFLAYWVSERDSGQTNAINKGFARSSGEIMGWLNSDDILLPGALHHIAHALMARPDVQLVTGFRKVLDMQSRVTSNFVQDAPTNYYLHHYCCIAQETTYWRSSLWKDLGPLDESLHFAMDYEYWLRAIERGYSFQLVPHYTGGFRNYAENKTNSWIDVYRRDMRTLYRRYRMGFEEADIHAQMGARWARRYGFYLAIGNQSWTNSTRLIELTWRLLESPVLCDGILALWHYRRQYLHLRDAAHKSRLSALRTVAASAFKRLVTGARHPSRVPSYSWGDIRAVPSQHVFAGDESEQPLPANTITLGEGWYPLEVYEGDYFRWCRGVGEIFIHNADSDLKTLSVVVSPVAQEHGGTLSLLDDQGRELANVLLDRHGLEIHFDLPLADTRRARFELRWNGAVPAPPENDPRQFAFRLFRIGWRTAVLAEIVPRLSIRHRLGSLPLLRTMALPSLPFRHTAKADDGVRLQAQDSTVPDVPAFEAVSPAPVNGAQPAAGVDVVAAPSLAAIEFREYSLLMVMTIAFCAALCGAETWEQVREFAETKATWLARFLGSMLELPSDDELRQLFELFDPPALEAMCLGYVRQLFWSGDEAQPDLSALDPAFGTHPQHSLYLVSTLHADDHLLLGQRAAEDSQHPDTLLSLIDHLRLDNRVAIIQATDCHAEIVQHLVSRHHDYLIAVDAHQPLVYHWLVDWFEAAERVQFAHAPVSYAATTAEDQGQTEVRCWSLSEPSVLEQVAQLADAPPLASVAVVERVRQAGDRSHTERVFFLTSLPADAGRMLETTRTYRVSPGQLQWTLAVGAREQAGGLLEREAGDDLSSLRTVTQRLLERSATDGSVSRKRFRAALDEGYLLQLLAHA